MVEDPGTSPKELPIPADFPVRWDYDEEKSLFWRWDNTHSPLPASPMSASLWESLITQGIGRAAKELRRVGRVASKRFNGYAYTATLPGTPTHEDQEAQRLAMEAAGASLRRRWDDEYLPKLVRDLEYMRSLDLKSATDAQLTRYLEEFIEIQREHWYIHFLTVFPVSGATEQMADHYREIMGEAPDEEPYLLLQGIDNKSLETDRALQSLADEARVRPEVAAVFTKEPEPSGIISELAGLPQGQEFLARLDDFLSVYGYRPIGFDFVFPSWIEDPSFVILNVKSYLASAPRDLAAEAKDQAAAAQRQLGVVLAKLGPDQARKRQFLEAYELVRDLWPLREDHAFYIDQGSLATLRILLAELGVRLAGRNVLSDGNDVFYLTYEELVDAMQADDNESLSDVVAVRRAERQRFCRVIPPRFLGTLPADGVIDVNPEFRRMFGPVDLSPHDETSGVLRGAPVSRGSAVGPARLIRSPDEFGKIRPGDILVCTSTSPTWTPLFGTVRAIVSDSGGVLSHTAIVAREYGLPGVVGVRHGTSSITDGQLVTVDADNGIVLLH